MNQVTIKLGAIVKLSFEGGENEYLVTSAGEQTFIPYDEVLVFRSVKFPITNNTPERFEITVPKKKTKE
jgi:hypothetical protein